MIDVEPARPAVLDELARALAGAQEFTPDHRPGAAEFALLERTCRRCPVAQECRDYAAQAPVHGVWGGVWHGPTNRRPQAA